ncbi:MAG: hypothetical protein K2O52_03405 [Oscillospiraceae bacterium]|nr:hypothetical protein [Oscillospiraceae bacterium]MDE7093942.1 hypothetical protein [Oscillospiraceae bacterium]
MKIKPKGRKIYRRKDRFEHAKHVRHNTASVIMTFLLAGAIGFVGYSAGSPIVAFLQEKHFFITESENNNDNNNPEITDTTESEENTEITETTEIMETTEEITEPTTEEQLGFIQKAPDMQGYELDISALMTETALAQALEELPEGLSHVLVPLKINGGGVYYATSVQDAVKSSAVQAVLSLDKIYEMITAKGYEPVAVINALQDDNYAKNYSASSYLKKDTGELWEDKSAVEPRIWLSPESSLTQDYLSAFAEEIEQANFKILVCEGLSFPNFPRSDLDNLDAICGDTDRYQALTDLLVAMRTNAPEISIFVRIDGDNALFGDLETMYAAEYLPADCLLVTMNAENKNDVETLKSLSTTVPIIIEWQGEEAPKTPKLESYVLNPESES